MKYCVLCLLVMVSLTGCNGDTQKATSASDESVLNGVWESCYKLGETYVQYTTSQNNGAWEDTYFEYDDNACNKRTAEGLKHQARGTYVLGKQIELAAFRDSGLDIYQVTVIEKDAGRVHECYTLVGVSADELYYGQIDSEQDCTTLARRSTTLDLSIKLMRKTGWPAATDVSEVDTRLSIDKSAEGS